MLVCSDETHLDCYKSQFSACCMWHAGIDKYIKALLISTVFDITL